MGCLLQLCILLATTIVVWSVGTEFLYPHGRGVDQLLEQGFEASSGEVKLNVPIVFYGETYNSIFVNTNGLLSFLTDIPTFINVQFPLDYPVIAPFYSNVDTRGSGSVSYRETNDSGILYRVNTNIKGLFKNYTDFQATSVFIATWFNVGYYANGIDKLNTIQVVIASDGNDSYVQFIYPEDGIQWIQGQTLNYGLPDARAQAGVISHDRRLFTLPGSGTDQVSNLNKLSNANLPGVWFFRVGVIDEGDQIDQPDTFQDVLVQGAKETCQTGYVQCHSKAKCVDLIGGFCCVCEEGYFGNGRTCLKNEVPLRLIGKVSGTINGETLQQHDLHSYIVPSDGRAYTAISKIPASIGFSLPTLSIIGRTISWLVAKRTTDVKNGYDLTGGKFNHTATLTFPNTNDIVTIWSQFHGLDVFDQLRLDTEIHGTIPNIRPESKLSLAVVIEEYTVTGKGILQSESEQSLKVDNEKIPYKVTQSFSYNPCDYDEPQNVTTFKMKTKNILIKFEDREKIIRYGTSSKLVPLTDKDPCLYGATTCVENSYCIVDRDSFRCVCHPGYQHIYDSAGNVQCVDINECSTGTHYCDKHAQCINEEGSFTCRCDEGYFGDGRECNIDNDCGGECDPNADCITENEESYCLCKPGFDGDGIKCQPDLDCRNGGYCSPYGECVETQEGPFVCVCSEGYAGNGYICESNNTVYEETTPAVVTQQPPIQATTENRVQKYAKQCEEGRCWCPPGYLEAETYCYTDVNYKPPTRRPDVEDGDDVTRPDDDDYARPIAQCLDPNTCFCPPGYTYSNSSINCIPMPGLSLETQGSSPKWQCNVLNNCHPEAQCIYISNEGHYQCRCNVDYEGNGYDCVKREIATCDKVFNCGENAECVLNPDLNEYICVCGNGFEGDGTTCLKKEDECRERADCGEAEDCQINIYNQKYECVCQDGFSKQDGVCTVVAGSCGGGTCIENAQCQYDSDYRTYYCQCNSGYIGDGINECRPKTDADCNTVNNCGVHGYCEFDVLQNGYLCKCEFGYFGDGFVCTSEPTCDVDPYLCDPAASCILGPESKYVCQCAEGHIGNGSHCRPAPKLESGFLLASQEIATFRIPFNADKKHPGKTINIKSNQFAIAIDIDCRDGRVYWSDLDEKKIKSSAYDGSEFKVFLGDNIGSPEGLSIDWVSRNIFWVDALNKTVEVANLDTKLRKVLFTQDVSNPRGITVHPQRGKIFWSDWNRNSPKIEWANMDGTGRQIYLHGSSVVLPNSLAIDWAVTDNLCYADAGTQKIECIDIDTRVKQTIIENLKYPFGLAITPSHFYWTDWKTLKIESVDRETKSVRKALDVPLGGFSKLYGLVAVQDRCPAGQNHCQYNNGNCSPGHLCLPNGNGGRTCVCASSDMCNDV